jgi:hypothetical protein
VAIYITGVGTDSFLLTFAGATLTDHVKSCTINMDYDDVDVTAMGATAHAHMAGLRDDSIDIEFYQNFASSKVHASISPYLGATSGATLVVQTSASTVTAVLPKFSMLNCIPFTYHPIDGTVGEALMTNVSFKPLTGSSIAIGTS